MIETISVDQQTIDGLSDKNLQLTCDDLHLPNEPHMGLILTNGKQSILAKVMSDLTIQKIKCGRSVCGLKARSAEQHFYFNYLTNPNIDLVMATGKIGTGKSLLAVAAAVDIVINERGPQKQIFLTKSLSEVGRYRIGPVPGNIREKFAPYIENYLGALSKIIGYDIFAKLERMEGQEIITFKPVNVLQGMSIDNSIVILDEAQNIDRHELRKIVTRVGENTRLFILGDVAQSNEANTNGLITLVRSTDLLESPFCASIELIKNERSRLSLLLDNILS